MFLTAAFWGRFSEVGRRSSIELNRYLTNISSWERCVCQLLR